MPLGQHEWHDFWQMKEALKTQLLSHQVPDEYLLRIDQAVDVLASEHDWPSLIRLRDLFSDFIVGEVYGGVKVLEKLATAGIDAADHSHRYDKAGQYLHDLGRNLHRIGNHHWAIYAFGDFAKCSEKAR